MPRVGLSTTAVVDAALAIVDENGLESLTLAAVAQRTGVATPSLYKHVGSLAELRVLVGVRVSRRPPTGWPPSSWGGAAMTPSPP